MAWKNADWLALGFEEALEPDLEICDPHHHLWLNQPHRIAPRYGFDEILTDIGAGHFISKTVFIDAAALYRAEGPDGMRPVGETEFVNGIAAISASGDYGPCRIAAGIVGFADLTLAEEVGPVLDAHVATAGGRFKGIRHGVSYDPALPEIRTRPGPHLLADTRYRAGAAELVRRGLSLDIWCYHPQIPDVTTFARALPDLSLIVNHLGIPLGVGPYAGRREEVFTTWRDSITDLASCPNVHMKLGGLQMVENGFGWHEQPRPPDSTILMQATRRYYETAISLFGVERCMFESNFPVDGISCGYGTIWNSFKRLTEGWSKAERRALFHDTAARIYRL